MQVALYAKYSTALTYVCAAFVECLEDPELDRLFAIFRQQKPTDHVFDTRRSRASVSARSSVHRIQVINFSHLVLHGSSEIRSCNMAFVECLENPDLDLLFAIFRQ